MAQPAHVLASTAAIIAFTHTLVGVDHTLPFVVLGRARQWTMRKTLAVTAFCGVLHVASSMVLGSVGLLLGVATEKLNWFEAKRGPIAAWALLGFGLLYALWGIIQTLRGKSEHTHCHAHPDGTLHTHGHHHEGEERHEKVHDHAHHEKQLKAATLGTLAMIFLVGPCEPLIPLLALPAARGAWGSVGLVSGVFAAVTVVTMVVTVWVGTKGMQWNALRRFEKHMTTFAGVAVAASGALILVFDL